MKWKQLLQREYVLADEDCRHADPEAIEFESKWFR
jgi:hypothetical protein